MEYFQEIQKANPEIFRLMLVFQKNQNFDSYIFTISIVSFNWLRVIL